MGWFAHTHVWKEIARTYAAPVSLKDNNFDAGSHFKELLHWLERMARGETTILWQCQDPECTALRKESMPGKIVEPAQELGGAPVKVNI